MNFTMIAVGMGIALCGYKLGSYFEKNRFLSFINDVIENKGFFLLDGGGKENLVSNILFRGTKTIVQFVEKE